MYTVRKLVLGAQKCQSAQICFTLQLVDDRDRFAVYRRCLGKMLQTDMESFDVKDFLTT